MRQEGDRDWGGRRREGNAGRGREEARASPWTMERGGARSGAGGVVGGSGRWRG
ncbi:hypothetical protein Fmac_019479 [Flemingia macrophylla]|uniref:Uncharacterized protein n=1 Tax=Flemingia macrophylla TaxID=520843 RepID=A0ABD1M7X9_9FABA